MDPKAIKRGAHHLGVSHCRNQRHRSGSEAGRHLVLDDSQVVLKYSQFTVESMLGVVNLQPILEDQLCFLGGCVQFRMLVDFVQSQDGICQTLETVLQFGNPLYHFGRGCLRLRVGIECDFAFNLLDVLRDGGFPVVLGVDDLRNDACQWILIRLGTDYKSEFP
jgi:hypothetical protein